MLLQLHYTPMKRQFLTTFVPRTSNRTNISFHITQYGSTVYIGIAMVYPTIYKDIFHFHFKFEVDFTFNDIKVKNVHL